MKSIKLILLVGVLVVVSLLAGGGQAQTPEPAGGDSLSADVAAAISYQGLLTDQATGAPLSGTYDLEFTFWSASSGGAQVGSTVTRSGQNITDGLYSTSLNVSTDAIHGQELWLQIRVRSTGGVWETLSPRLQVLPTTYALTVRPKARIEGGVGRPNAIVMATNTSSGWGLRGESRDPSGYGVYGYNGSTSTAAYGGGVIGITQTDGYGVRGEAPSSGDFSYGGYFRGRVGVRSYASGTDYFRDYGGYFLAERRGIYADSLDSWYAGYFNDAIFVNGTIYPMLAGRTLAVNGGDEILEPGDVVAISGVATPLEDGGEPMLAVRKASGAGDTAVVGVAVEAMLVQEVERLEDPRGQTSVDVQPVEGNVVPGGYLAIVTNGLVPAVKVTAVEAESLGIGDLVGPAVSGRVQRAEAQNAPGTILGKVAGPYDPKTGTVPVFVTLD
jgi:hypothetical protein